MKLRRFSLNLELFYDLKLQDSLFKMPKVRRFFNIPQILEQPVLAKGGKTQSNEIDRTFWICISDCLNLISIFSFQFKKSTRD